LKLEFLQGGGILAVSNGKRHGLTMVTSKPMHLNSLRGKKSLARIARENRPDREKERGGPGQQEVSLSGVRGARIFQKAVGESLGKLALGRGGPSRDAVDLLSGVGGVQASGRVRRGGVSPSGVRV